MWLASLLLDLVWLNRTELGNITIQENYMKICNGMFWTF